MVAYRYLTNDFCQVIRIDFQYETLELDDGDIVEFNDVELYRILE